MGYPLSHVSLPPVPTAEVSYEPSYEILFVENGKSSEVAEEMARRVIVYFDKDKEDEAVAIRIDSAEWVLKPFVDAVLAKHGMSPNPNARQQWQQKGYRETVSTSIGQGGLVLAPYSEAVYDAASQTLLIENGEASNVSKEMAKDVHVLYGKDYDGGEWLASVGIRIDHSETVLKPFVDAILAKHGAKAEEETADRAADK